ncbi:hypothetical protein [Brevibacillus laterosporus]|nr:hypothetical protein [Brevibacillus laterosporus]
MKKFFSMLILSVMVLSVGTSVSAHGGIGWISGDIKPFHGGIGW